MKKISILFLSILFLSSCLKNDEPQFRYEYLKINSIEAPDSFIYGEIDSIKVKFTLPNNCYSFNELYYQKDDTTRIVAGIARISLDKKCNTSSKESEYIFPVKALQKREYVFKFWKGKDQDGKDLYTEVIIPVN